MPKAQLRQNRQLPQLREMCIRDREYIDSLNKATGKVVTGMEARQSAMLECIGEMTQKGIPAFVDKNGRNWTSIS